MKRLFAISFYALACAALLSSCYAQKSCCCCGHAINNNKRPNSQVGEASTINKPAASITDQSLAKK